MLESTVFISNFHLYNYTLQDATSKSEQYVSEHAQYQDSYQIASDWLNLHRDRLTICSDATGGKHALVSKLDRAQDLTNSLPNGKAKIDACVKNSEATTPHTGAQGKQTVQYEVDSLTLEWSNYETQLSESKAKLEDALKQWKVKISICEIATDKINDTGKRRHTSL